MMQAQERNEPVTKAEDEPGRRMIVQLNASMRQSEWAIAKNTNAVMTSGASIHHRDAPPLARTVV
jgi:hypothetical protein